MRSKNFSRVLYLSGIFGVLLTAMIPAMSQSRPELSTTIVISQVYSGGGSTQATVTYKKDYVELKNISSSPQSISGLSLQYGAAVSNIGTGANTIYTFTGAVTLQPGQYYLVELGALGMPPGGADIMPVPNESTTSVSMSAASGKVALTNTATALACGATASPCVFPNANIIDFVAYGAAGNGTAGNGEGGTSVNNGVALPANTNGAVRKTGGCTETDNNNLDFDVVVNPVPRNASSTATPCGAAAVNDAPYDFNGDGKTDYAVIRNSAGGANGQLTWYTLFNGGASTQADWGIALDTIAPGDYDGDAKDDIAVFRQGAPGTAGFYILSSGAGTFSFVQFGQTNDEPVVTDYTGDGKDDPAIFRGGTGAGQQATFWYQASSGPLNGVAVATNWGSFGDTPVPGDYTGDGKADFCVQRPVNGSGVFFMHPGTGGPDGPGADTVTFFGLAADFIVPGDYDGDDKTDFAVVRAQSGSYVWYYQSSMTGSVVANFWGSSATDVRTPGDYDGDGKHDFAVWRRTAENSSYYFYVNASTAGFSQTAWGLCTNVPLGNCDVPVAVDGVRQ